MAQPRGQPYRIRLIEATFVFSDGRSLSIAQTTEGRYRASARAVTELVPLADVSSARMPELLPRKRDSGSTRLMKRILTLRYWNTTHHR